jgi:hypothetical protein
MPTNTVSGSIAVPLGARIGFGVPDTADQEPTGPQVMVVDGDPNGTVEATVGTLALDPTTPTLWQNTDGATAWAQAGGGAGAWQSVQVRIQASDLVDPDPSYSVLFPALPANAGAVGYAIYVTDPPAGGGVTSVQANSGGGGVSMIENEQLVGAGAGAFIQPFNGNGAAWFDGTTIVWPGTALAVSLFGDVNLNTLTNFDVTFYVFYVLPIGMTIP